MHKRILFGLVAWLLGAATATAGSLLAVSLLGQGIGGGSAQQLTQDAVNRAIASEAVESSPAAAPAPSRTVRSAARPAKPSPTATPDPTAVPSASPTPSATQSTQSTQSTTPSPSGTVFTSQGGEVVATCQAAGAYLLSWSPLQGYEVSYVVRGPAADARVSFETNTSELTMVVTCSAGVPSVTTSTGH